MIGGDDKKSRLSPQQSMLPSFLAFDYSAWNVGGGKNSGRWKRPDVTS